MVEQSGYECFNQLSKKRGKRIFQGQPFNFYMLATLIVSLAYNLICFFVRIFFFSVPFVLRRSIGTWLLICLNELLLEIRFIRVI